MCDTARPAPDAPSPKFQAIVGIVDHLSLAVTDSESGSPASAEPASATGETAGATVSRNDTSTCFVPPESGDVTVAKWPCPSPAITGSVSARCGGSSVRVSPHTPAGVRARAWPMRAPPVVSCSQLAAIVPSSAIATDGAYTPTSLMRSIGPKAPVSEDPMRALALLSRGVAPACVQARIAVPERFTATLVLVAVNVASAPIVLSGHCGTQSPVGERHAVPTALDPIPPVSAIVKPMRMSPAWSIATERSCGLVAPRRPALTASDGPNDPTAALSRDAQMVLPLR